MREPDLFPRFGTAYADALRSANAEGKPTALGTPLRMSSAGSCLLAQQLAALDVPPSDEPDEASLWSMRLGTLAHADIQAVLAERYPGCEAEVKVVDGPGSSGHIDVTFRRPDGTVAGVIEVKTVNPVAFDIAIGVSRLGAGKRRTEGPKGPSANHVLQAARSAAAVDADEMTVLYLCVAPVPRRAARSAGLAEHERWRAEWSFQRNAYLELLPEEHRRMQMILDHTEEGVLAPRLAVDDAGNPEILNPNGGGWRCDYCDWRSLCLTLDARGAATTDEAVAVARDMAEHFGGAA